jgi:hypothetical protein
VIKQRHKGSTITGGNAVFTDQYTAAVLGGEPPKDMKPVPMPPQKPLGQTLAAKFDHWWYVGTKTTGKGVQISAFMIGNDWAVLRRRSFPFASADLQGPAHWMLRPGTTLPFDTRIDLGVLTLAQQGSAETNRVIFREESY